MKLDSKTKKQIDDFFNNKTPEELYELALKYRMKELDEALNMRIVNRSKRIEFTQDTYLSDGIYEIETDKGRTFKAEYTLGRWFEYMVDIEPNEKIVAYYC